MGTLPSQVLRPLYAAMDGRRSIKARSASFAECQAALDVYVEHIGVWSNDVTESMQRHGAETVDRDNAAESEEFLANVGRATLEKRHTRETAIAAAKLQLGQIAKELGS